MKALLAGVARTTTWRYRLRSAGRRIASALGYTHGYHMWHPTEPSRPAKWTDGPNVERLQSFDTTDPMRGWTRLAWQTKPKACSRAGTDETPLPRSNFVAARGLSPTRLPLRTHTMRIAFFSTMGGLPWGGSEELWSRAAAVLLERGHEVAFNCLTWPAVAAPLQRLIDRGANAHFRSRRRLGRTLRQTLQKLRLTRLKYVPWLRKCRPDFVVISFSCHTDDPQIANTCRALGHAVCDRPPSRRAAQLDRSPQRSTTIAPAYANARRCFFVSVGQPRDARVQFGDRVAALRNRGQSVLGARRCRPQLASHDAALEVGVRRPHSLHHEEPRSYFARACGCPNGEPARFKSRCGAATTAT